MSITFSDLWEKYPEGDSCDKQFSNQCAINLSQCLVNAGISLTSFSGTKCWFGHKPAHILRAQEMANWLKQRPFVGCPEPTILTGETFIEAIRGKTGLIFFADYWQRSNEQGTNRRTGDHIDLWNRNRLQAEWSWVRINLGVSWDGVISDFRLSKEVLFWEIK